MISFDEEFGHMGSRKNLIGETNNWKLAKRYSNELQVTKDTPPTCLILADDDRAVHPENSICFYSALKKYNVPAEIHIFQEGGHGFGMLKKELPVDQWPSLAVKWLRSIKIID